MPNGRCFLVKLFPEGKESSWVTSCCKADVWMIPLWGSIHKCHSQAATSGCVCIQQLSSRKVQGKKRSIIKILFESTWHPAQAIMQQPEYAKEQRYEYKKWVFWSLSGIPWKYSHLRNLFLQKIPFVLLGYLGDSIFNTCVLDLVEQCFYHDYKMVMSQFLIWNSQYQWGFFYDKHDVRQRASGLSLCTTIQNNNT